MEATWARKGTSNRIGVATPLLLEEPERKKRRKTNLKPQTKRMPRRALAGPQFGVPLKPQLTTPVRCIGFGTTNPLGWQTQYLCALKILGPAWRALYTTASQLCVGM
jgi:hypothetical protein